MRYKDVVREQILHAETAEDAISSDEDGDADDDRGDGGPGRGGGGGEGRRGLAYDEEQEQLRRGFLGVVAEHDGGGRGSGGGGGDEGGDCGGSGDGGEGSSSGEDGEGLLKVGGGLTKPCRFACRVYFVFFISCGLFGCLVFLPLPRVALLGLFVRTVAWRGCVLLLA